MLKVWGRTSSSNVMKVLWACGEMGISYERVDWGGAFGGNDDPAYRALNPNGVVPTIEDDGLVLWESNAIVRYLGRKHGNGTFVPADARMQADADRWMDWQQTTLNPPFGTIFLGLVRTPEPQRDHAAIADAVARVQGLLAVLDRRLADRPFVAGGALTMGDIPFGPIVHRWYSLPIDRRPLPHLEAWYGRMKQRSPFVTTIASLPVA